MPDLVLPSHRFELPGEIPLRTLALSKKAEILRLRRANRFALGSAALRMTHRAQVSAQKTGANLGHQKVTGSQDDIGFEGFLIAAVNRGASQNLGLHLFQLPRPPVVFSPRAPLCLLPILSITHP
jgi:hypothetical protein